MACSTSLSSHQPSRPQDDHFLLTRNDALDTVEEIIDYIDEKIPCPNIQNDNIIAETVARDFFSKFCFFIKVRERILKTS